MNYNGNQLTNVADAVNPGPLYAGAFNFVDSISSGIEYKYDANGNLTEDLNKKIARIQYNSLNLPSRLQFIQGHTTLFLYDADGVKRSVKQVTTLISYENKNCNILYTTTLSICFLSFQFNIF